MYYQGNSHAVKTWIWYLEYSCYGPLCQKHKPIVFVCMRTEKTKIDNLWATLSTRWYKLYMQTTGRFNTIIIHSNALAFVMRRLIGLRQKFGAVYPAIYCRKQFDIINYVKFHLVTCGIMRLAPLQFETKLQKCIRMGITIFKIFLSGGISSDMLSEITFYSIALASP